MRRAAKVDANQREIVMALMSLGWYWLDLTRVGSGCPDGLASRAGVLRLCEIKTANGRLTRQQAALQFRMPFVILRSVQDAIELR